MRLRRPRTRAQWIAAAAGALLLLGAAFWLVAPYNIAASIPHLPGVRPLLKGYLYNAVRTWSLGEAPPERLDLDDPALVARGAGHFESGCAPCHGAPGRPRNPVVRGMRPEPPELSKAAGHLADRELYWIALNGFKYTGMPAWAAQRRPEEPWALAAFLRRYAELDAEAYRALAYGPVAAEAAVGAGHAVSFGGLNARLGETRDNCARCHGLDGLGRDGVAPKLAGQSAAYLLETLEAYASGARPSGFMEPLAAALSPAERRNLAEHYAGLPRFEAEPDAPAPGPLIAEGARLAAEGDAARDIPSCLACHGPGAEPPRRPQYPHIAGQDRRWLVAWLRLWREEAFGGTRYAGVMHEAARTLDDAEIEALAAFFAAGAETPAAAAAR